MKNALATDPSHECRQEFPNSSVKLRDADDNLFPKH